MEKLSPEQQERLQEYLETRKISKYRIAHETRWNQVGIIS